MSNWRKQLSEDSETEAAVAWLTEYYHYPVLLVLIGFAFWNRIRNWSNFVVDGTVYYSGNDPWYHRRETEYATDNFLGTMAYDPWTYFPFGTSADQFGTLFDQLIALVAIILGLGSPSASLVDHVFLLAPPFFAVAICIPAYFIARRLGGRFGGLVAVGFIALAPDRLLQMTLAGHVQHHSAEVLFMSLSFLAMMVALSAAEREKPVFELVTSGDLDTLRGTIGWSLLAGVGMALYLYAWPPGLWIFGILGAFFVIHMSWEHVRGRSPEHTAFVGVISLTTAGLIHLSSVRTLEFTVTSRSIFHPGLAFAVVAGILFLAVLSRQVEQQELTPYAYPASVAVSIIAVVGGVALLLPDLFGFFFSQVDRVLGFITTPGTAAGTIGEAQPPSDRTGYLFDRYHLAAVTALIGALVVLGRQIIRSEPKAEELLIVVWAAFMVAATFTQVRFGYYLTVPIGALNAVLAGFLMKTIGTPTDKEFTIETYQVLTIALVVMVMFVPLLGLPFIGADNTAMDRADSLSQPGSVVAWDSSFEFMSENTPEPGQYGNADGEPMEYLGDYDRTDDFEYPDGAYGVLSWWDYGHWITTQGERIPNANPFQQGASEAAHTLLAQDEDEALDRIEEDFDDHENAQTEYVTIDWQMVQTETSLGGTQISGKFFAPADFHSEFDRGDFYGRIGNIDEQRGLQTSAMVHEQAYYDSLMVRLYHFHGSAVAPGDNGPIPVVQHLGERQTLGNDEGFFQAPQDEEEVPVRLFNTEAEAEEFMNETESNTRIGGVGAHPSEPVDALEQFRLVHMNDVDALDVESHTDVFEAGTQFGHQFVAQRDAGLLQGAPMSGIAQQLPVEEDGDILRESMDYLYHTDQTWTKTFERVPGGTIEGTGPEETEVNLQVEMEPENGDAFTYRQTVETDENGEFTATVPYSTTGYDELGVEDGYTEPAVRANGSYEISTTFFEEGEEFVQYVGSADISEAQVLGEDDSAVTVELEAEELEFDFGDEEGEDGEETTSEETNGEGAESDE